MNKNHLNSIQFLSLSLDSFKDPIEAAQLLTYLARINSWPIAIFTDLKYLKQDISFNWNVLLLSFKCQ